MPDLEKKRVHCVIWAGPVSASNLSGARLPSPSRIVTVNQGTGGKIGSSAFASLGRKYVSARALLRSRGIELDDCETLTLAGFSAAHGLFEVLLRDPETRERTSALVAADAYYTGAAGSIKPGYSAFARKAATGAALAVFSSSPIAGPGYPSCTDALGPLMAQFEPVPVLQPVAIDPPPARAFRRAGLWWFQYDQAGKEGHRMHATRVAPAVLSKFVSPYLTRRAVSSAPDALAAAVALILLAIS